MEGRCAMRLWHEDSMDCDEVSEDGCDEVCRDGWGNTMDDDV